MYIIFVYILSDVIVHMSAYHSFSCKADLLPNPPQTSHPYSAMGLTRESNKFIYSLG